MGWVCAASPRISIGWAGRWPRSLGADIAAPAYGNLTWEQAVVHSRTEGNVMSQPRMTWRNPWFLYYIPVTSISCPEPGGCGNLK